MSTTGAKAPGTLADDASFGAIAWTNPGNAASSDNVYATAAFTGAGTSHYLKATNFGFSIPSDARINGVTTTIERACAAGGVVTDNFVFLVVAGVVQQTGKNQYRPEAWSTVGDEVVTYASPSDQWAIALTPAIVNASGFGVAIAARKFNGGAHTASIDAITLTVYYQRPGDTDVTVVKLRASQPPHDELQTLRVQDLSYGRMLMRKNTASFRISRADPNLAKFRHLLTPDGPPPMFSIERPDGTHPWAGFLQDYVVRSSDPTAQFVLADHAWRLEESVTAKTGVLRGAFTDVVIRTLREIDARGEPALYLQYDHNEGGPRLDYAYQAAKGLDFLQQAAKFTGWEWGFAYNVSPAKVETTLMLRQSIGRDVRDSVVLDEGVHLKDIDYSLRYSEGIAAGLVVGGTGTFGDRSAVAASRNGRAREGVDTRTASNATQRGIGGTRVLIDRQVTEQQALINAAQRLHTSPEWVPEQVGFVIVEGEVDMARFTLGDTQTIRLDETDLSTPRVLYARTIGINYNPQTREHRVEAKVVT